MGETFYRSSLIKVIKSLLIFINSKISRILIYTIFLSASFVYADQYNSADTVEIKDEPNIVCDIGLSTLKVTGQITGGFLGGLITGAMFRVHPVTTGIGWVIGSSAAVYLIGNISGGKGNYWWTAASGAVPLLLFVIPLDKTSGSFDTGSMIFGALIISLASEIAGYYITKPFETQNENFGNVNVNSNIFSTNKFIDNTRLKCPRDISINIIQLNF